MLTGIEQLVKILQALLELFKEAKKAPLLCILGVSLIINIWVGYNWYTVKKQKELDRNEWVLSDKRKDSLFNAYLLKMNEELLRQRESK